ncbi:MAG: hypothetical protein H7Y27_08420 [Gemmatimonadaceae bacterium]|nr:hypothetical protein [Chitinophagaceae bacterium]
MKRKFILQGVGMLMVFFAQAQNYQALHGSSYAGSLGIQQNPATMLSTPYKWDLTLIGTQVKSSTNAMTIYKYSLLSSPANSEYGFDKGEYERKLKLSYNLNLLNARIALNRRTAIGFGVNLRNYANLKTGKFNFIDTLKGSSQFFKINEGNNLNGQFVNAGWIELFLSYSRTIFDYETSRLNAGVTVKLGRGVSGIYTKLSDGRFERSGTAGNDYLVSQGSLVYGYSSNMDRWSKANSTGQNLRNMVKYTEGGGALDFGLEYIVKPQELVDFNDPDTYYDYEWKASIALLDVGGSQFKFGNQSRSLAGVKANISDETLDQKFPSLNNNLKDFNDSLATIVNQVGAVSGNFRVINPMRLVVNVDHFLRGGFYINGEVSINMPTSLLKDYLHVNEISFITVTPRWETRRWGAYLPLQFNNEQQFWVGLAFKAGPLVLGVHNVANLFSKTSVQNGGGYLALVLRAPGDTKKRTDRRLNCPPAVW